MNRKTFNITVMLMTLLLVSVKSTSAQELPPCFAPLVEELEAQAEVNPEGLDAKKLKAIGKALVALFKGGISTRKDLKTIAKVTKKLAKTFSVESRLVLLAGEALECLLSSVQEERNALAQYIERLPENKATLKVKKLLALATSSIEGALGAETSALAAKLLTKAASKIAAGWKGTLKIPELVTASIGAFDYESSGDAGLFDLNGNVLSISSTQPIDPALNTFHRLDIYARIDPAPGEYPIGDSLQTNEGIWAPNQNIGCVFDCPIYRSTGGTITVERVVPGKFIEGTFEYVAERRLGNGPPSVSVTGWFRIKFLKSK